MSAGLIGRPLSIQAHPTTTFVGDGATTTWPLPYNPGSGTAILLFVDGIFQPVNYSYSVSGTNLVTTEPADFKSRLDVVYLSLAGATISGPSSGPAYGVATGTDTYLVTTVPTITGYQTGMTMTIKFTNANATTTPTLNTDGIGVKGLYKRDGTNLSAGNIAANSTYFLFYDTSFNTGAGGWGVV